MALVSPGIELSIVDQSQYLASPSNSVPLIILATAQNKANAAGTGVASATTSSNAGKLFQVTSQRDLVDLYGSPYFYTSTNGTPIQGYELNEYGLLAAYSVLGVTNRCFVLRADIDLASLVGQTGRPTGQPNDGTMWLDTSNSTWGIYEYNSVTETFTEKFPLVVSTATQMSAGVPLQSIGNIGDYAVNPLYPESGYSYAASPSGHTYFVKNTDNTWAALGTKEWAANIPVVTGTESFPTLTAGQSFSITTSTGQTAVITVPVATNNTVTAVSALINALGWDGLSTAIVSGRLTFYTSFANSTQDFRITLADISSGTALAEMGFVAGSYYQPIIQYGTFAQVPTWRAGLGSPRPSKSVWIKVGTAGNGLNPVVSTYNASTKQWVSKNVYLASSDWAAIASLDSTGGLTIPAGTVYAQYASEYSAAPLYVWERVASGVTTVIGTDNTPVFGATATLFVQTSVPGSSSLSSVYSVSITATDTASDFVTAWSAASIPWTTASVTVDGAIQITHTAGGSIVLNDHVAATGVSAGLLEDAGLVPGVTPGCKYGPAANTTFVGVNVTGGAGTGAKANIAVINDTYTILNAGGVSVAGTGYTLGDQVTIAGTLLGGATTANDLTLEVIEVGGSGEVEAFVIVEGEAATGRYTTQLSNWVEVTFEANEGAPVIAPLDNTNWFYSVIDEVDIMVQKNGSWVGYGTTSFDSSGHPTLTGTPSTDRSGPIISASTPTTQTDGTALVYGDLWVDTSDLDNYPAISRWQLVGTTDRWVRVNNTDQVSSSGIVFADARWATSGTVNPANDPIATITSLVLSSYVDLDAPVATTYPQGTLLFNTRRSGYNVKQYRVDYFSDANFPDESLPTERDAWVTVSGNKADGSPYMGRKAQRAVVVQALDAAVAVSGSIRDEDNAFNLMAAPNYPELQPTMVALNNDRGMTSFIIGDTPLRLADNATDIQNWANNNALANRTGEDGCVTRDTYLGLFYPSGITTDLSGNQVVVPASHMMLRTFLRSDNVSYPWLAPAGTRRGTIDNATNIGYLDGATGEFQVTKSNMGIRDALYTNSINPLVFFTGVGLLNYGNKTSFASSSALDRINVARLITFLRRQLTLAIRPFVFEPNDSLTRSQVAAVVQTLLVELVAKRGLYDYIVVCDNSNNTAARIDRNELWVDVAIEPVKATEFIYIPVRVLNTGALSGGTV